MAELAPQVPPQPIIDHAVTVLLSSPSMTRTLTLTSKPQRQAAAGATRPSMYQRALLGGPSGVGMAQAMSVMRPPRRCRVSPVVDLLPTEIHLRLPSYGALAG